MTLKHLHLIIAKHLILMLSTNFVLNKVPFRLSLYLGSTSEREVLLGFFSEAQKKAVVLKGIALEYIVDIYH